MTRDLTLLIERVRSGSGADERLDAEIMCAIAAPDGSFVEQSRFNFAWCIYEKPGRLWNKRDWHRPDGWPLTSSLDAVVALVEKKLPGKAVAILEEAVTKCALPSLTLEKFPREYLARFLTALQAQEAA